MDSIKLAIKELEGTWALTIMNKQEPNSLYVCKKGSPLLIAYNDHSCIVSSEVSGFSNHLKDYYVVSDDEIIKIHYDNKIKFYRDHELTKLSTKEVISAQINAVTPDPYPYWTLKEIHEQSDAAKRALNNGGRILDQYSVNLGGLKDHQSELLKIKNLTIIASGTSYHAGYLGMKYMQSLFIFNTIKIVDSSEFTLNDLTKSGAGVIILSQSGETRDIIQCIELIRENRPEIIICSLVNVVESTIAREANCGVYLNAGREVGVASTKSFTNQVIILYLITIWFLQSKGKYKSLRKKMVSSVQNIGALINESLDMIKEDCQNVVPNIVNHESLFILGRDKGLPIAMEGSLKIKEISYIHAEAYPAGGLKHGPLALITKGTPVIIIRIGDLDMITKLDIAARETKTRGAYLISIGSQRCDDPDLYDVEIKITRDNYMEPILANLPLQYLAYLLSVGKGYNPDYPRNLAKCVTVD